VYITINLKAWAVPEGQRGDYSRNKFPPNVYSAILFSSAN